MQGRALQTISFLVADQAFPLAWKELEIFRCFSEYFAICALLYMYIR